MRIKINGKEIIFFTDLNINLSLDSIASTFSFLCRFNPENDDHKEIFKPLQYYKVEIFNSKDKLILTGTIINHSFKSDANNNLVAISGYSLSGILEDVTIPLSLYPLESLDRSLSDIAKRLCNAYGIGLIIDGSVSNLANQVFESSTANPSDTVKSYLSKLTSQKNIVLSHDVKGNVRMFRPNDNMKPKYYFNAQNTLEMSSSFNGQGLHSVISVVRQPSDENEGISTEDSVNNPLIGKYRPTTKVLSSGEEVDNSKAANNELAAELKNISVSVVAPALLDDIMPGDIVNVHNHEIYSFAYNRYMVSSISFKVSPNAETTELSLVLPETYTGNIPKNILFAYKSHLRGN